MNAPTLLIGLGGIGCKIVERVSRMVTEEQRKNIAFAVFDTDINDLGDIRRRSPFIKTIQTSTKQTVGEYLNKDIHARDTWFPVNAILNSKTLTEGAGQVRSISRLAFETVVRANKLEPLHEAIQSLYRVEEDKQDQALRVVIASSLAGGTGSGLILPVALYVQNYLKTKFRLSANITRGFFILPEVFYEVIPGQAERNNLCANAYATLRELDAFLMKGDKTLSKRYQDTLKILFPRVSSMGYDEIDVRPFDFCFLFDAQNAEGSKLNSFDRYLDHAANCIYAQSIGPMNKRSNSSEDNTIRKLAQARGRNRYAGAGASMMIYPFEDIRRFIALNWAKQTVSKQWMTYDNIYKEICRQNALQREQGINAPNPEPGKFYASQIDSLSKQEDSFAMAITRSCGEYDTDGVTRTGDRWKSYVGCILNKVKADIEESNSKIRSVKEDIDSQMGELSNDWNDYVSLYLLEEKYRLLNKVFVDDASQTIAYAMFKAPKSTSNSENLDYRLEKYLVSLDNNYLHPNAIRYLLIQTIELMKGNKLKLNKKINEAKSYFSDFEKNTFDDPSTEDYVEGAADLTNRKITLLSKITKKPTSEQEDIKQQLQNYLNKIAEYGVQCAQEYVLDQGIKHIQAIIDSFESFYKTFDSKVDMLDSYINDIYKKYGDSSGTTARYVCASKKCLQKLYEKKSFAGSTIVIDPGLAKEIFEQVFEYAMCAEKPNNNRYFSNLFDKGIVGYFENEVMRQYGSTIDIDIIEALENEAVYEMGYDQEENADSLIRQYVVKTINDIRKLSCPFIESPLGEPRDPIHACTFNISLEPQKGDDSPKAKLIQKELMNYGGAPDEDIPKYMIMFYQSFYGLRANDLSKFAPPEKSRTYNRSGGEYYKAYFDMVQNIHPEPHLSKEITPHIDRWWHVVTKMPDLDEGNQIRQENSIYAAFFWGIIGHFIDLYEDNTVSDAKIYKLKRDELNMDDDRLVVSNGTDCDKLYEVLDAIAIYPELVTKILKKIADLTEDDVNDKSPLEEGILYAFLEDFKMPEPGIGADNVPARSIFDIPVLMKKSVTPDLYYEENVISILKVELTEIRNYLSRFLSHKELCDKMSEILLDQFNKFIDDIKLEAANDPSLLKGSLFDRICSIISEEFGKMGKKAEQKLVKKTAEELKA